MASNVTAVTLRHALNSSALSAAVALVGMGCMNETADRDATDVGDNASALTQAAQPDAGDLPQQEITIASLPDSICKLVDDETGDSISASADDEGLVHLWATRARASKAFTLNCEEPNGFGAKRHENYRFDLADAQTFGPAVPRAVSKRRRIVPALTNPTAISQRDLTAAGYPPRPAAESAHYERWLALVSSPFVSIDANTISTDRFFGPAIPASDPVWGGVALINTLGTKYTQATGYIGIPTFFQQGTSTSQAALWVGLGGWNGDPSIIQLGVLATSTG